MVARMTATLSRWLACWSAVLTIGCGLEPTTQSDTPDASVTPRPLTLAQDIQPILNKHCVRCHAPGRRAPHFTAAASRRSLDGASDCMDRGARVALVTPGSPEVSFLLFKLGAPTDMDITGAPCDEMMPVDADAPLVATDPEAVARIRQWITDGAH